MPTRTNGYQPSHPLGVASRRRVAYFSLLQLPRESGDLRQLGDSLSIAILPVREISSSYFRVSFRARAAFDR